MPELRSYDPNGWKARTMPRKDMRRAKAMRAACKGFGLFGAITRTRNGVREKGLRFDQG